MTDNSEQDVVWLAGVKDHEVNIVLVGGDHDHLVKVDDFDAGGDLIVWIK